jgi:hypothetical protein
MVIGGATLSDSVRKWPSSIRCTPVVIFNRPGTLIIRVIRPEFEVLTVKPCTGITRRNDYIGAAPSPRAKALCQAS